MKSQKVIETALEYIRGDIKDIEKEIEIKIARGEWSNVSALDGIRKGLTLAESIILDTPRHIKDASTTGSQTIKHNRKRRINQKRSFLAILQ